MTEFKGTPGEWIPAAKPSSVVGWPIVSNHEGHLVCSLAWQPKPEHVLQEEYDAWISEVGANACLISAAKDLLESLSELLFEDSDKSEGARIATRLNARAAIAKALGEGQ